MVFILTKSAIAMISSGETQETDLKPVLQIADIRAVNTQNQSTNNERIEDFVSGLLLPLYFASSGLKTDVATIREAKAWGLLTLVITTACPGKILGTFGVALMCKIPVRESLTLGLLMNTKGLVELIVLNIYKEKKNGKEEEGIGSDSSGLIPLV